MAREVKKKSEKPAERVDTVSNHASSERKLEKLLGRNVRQHRKQTGLTVADLAAAAAISRGMLSKIENGQISPSLGTLQMLATALNLPVSALFASSEKRANFSVVKAGEGIVTQRRGSKAGYRYQLLGHALDGATAIEPYLVTLPKDAESCSNCQHEGAKFVYVLTGEMDYVYGDRTHHLKAGDAMLFDSTFPHGPQKFMKGPITYLAVVIYPRR